MSSPAEIRLALLKRGYMPIPCAGKRPPIGFDEWQMKTCVTPPEVTWWATRYPTAGNTGVLTVRTPCIDVDIMNEAAALAVEKLARGVFGEHGDVLVRIGQAPKRAILFRTDEPFGKLSRKYAGPDGSHHKIEILASGQQVVVDGIHPDTKRPYAWHGGSPIEIEREKLPYICLADAERFLEAASELLVHKHSFKPASASKSNGAAGDDGPHDRADWVELIANILTGVDLHDSATRLAAAYIASGMDAHGAQRAIEALFLTSDTPRDERWKNRFKEIAAAVRSAYAKFAKEEPEAEDELPGNLFKTESDFLTSYARPDYLVYGLLRRRFIYSLTAPTSFGKTAVCLLIAMLVLRGQSIDGRKVKRGRVLYLAGENDEDVYNRWIKMRESFGIAHDDNLDIEFLPGVPTRDMARLRAEADLRGPFDLVIIDTSAAFFSGEDENSNTELGDHAREMRKFTNSGAAVIVTCHPTKNYNIDNLLPRGGGAFLNEIDGNLVCIRENAGTSNPIVELTWHGKFRGPSFDRLLFKLTAVTSDDPRLTTVDGEKLWTVVAETATEAESDAAENEGASDRDAMLSLMKQVPGCSLGDMASQLRWNKRRVQTLMKTLVAEKLATKHGAHYELTKKGIKAADQVADVKRYEVQADMPF